MISIVVAGAVTGFLWSRVGNTLSVRTSIVGRTTFADFDVYHYLDRFYVVAVGAPVVGIGCFLLLSRWGPLAAVTDSASVTPVLRSEPRSPGARAVPAVWGLVASAALRALAVAAVVALEVGSGIGVHRSRWDMLGLAGSAGYLAVTCGAVVLTYLIGGRNREAARLVRHLSTANAVSAPVVIVLVCLVSASTSMTVASTGAVVHYPWFPWWLGAIIALAVMALVVRSLRASSSLAGPRRTEQRVLIWVVIPVAIYLMTAKLAPPVHVFKGFDDAQSLVGATLLFRHGLFPWRSAFLLHGVLDDAFYGQVGLSLFSRTVWGSYAGAQLVVFPLAVLTLYGFIMYFAKEKIGVAVGAAVVLVFTPFATPSLPRYVPLLGVMVLLFRTLQSGSWLRCACLMGGVLLSSLLSPETTVLVLPPLACVVLHDLYSFRRGSGASAFARTARCATTGLAVLALWMFVLAATGALSGFVDYYRSTISGHQLWGADPMNPVPWTQAASSFYLFVPIGLYLLTLAELAHRHVRRSVIEPIQFVTLAAALAVPVFYQVYFDRADLAHLQEVFAAVTPLVCLWGVRFVHAADRFGSSAVGPIPTFRGMPPRVRLAQPVAAIVAMALLVSALPRAGWVLSLPGRYRLTSPTPAVTSIPLGYSTISPSLVSQVRALGAALDAYAGPTAPVFDFVNEMGVSYFLLDRVPGARFYHVESAETPLAQSLEVGDLQRSRPPVVIFHDVYFGLPLNYDLILSEVRNYLISQFLLDHYTPLENVDGQTLLLRNDLYAARARSGQLPVGAGGSELYFGLPSCNWGDTPNFFVPPTGTELARAVPAPLTGGGTPGTWLVHLPAGTAWTDFQWLWFRSSAPAIATRYVITDTARAGSQHAITFVRMRRAGGEVFVRVGSCIQWHGYRTTSLTLRADGLGAGSSAMLVP